MTDTITNRTMEKIKMKTLEEIKQHITEAQAKKAKDIQEYTEKIATAQEDLKKAKQEMATAETSVNVDDYSKAKDMIRTAKNAIELYQKHKAKLEAGDFYDKQAMHNEIITVAGKVNADLINQTAEPIERLKQIADNSWDNIVKANDLIDTINGKPYGYSHNHHKEFLPQEFDWSKIKNFKQPKASNK